MSGRPLRARSTDLVRHVATAVQGRLVVVGVGGIFGPDDAWEKLAAGASLVQVYTGLIYEGPALAARIARGLARRMEHEGVGCLGEIVGATAG